MEMEVAIVIALAMSCVLTAIAVVRMMAAWDASNDAPAWDILIAVLAVAVTIALVVAVYGWAPGSGSGRLLPWVPHVAEVP